MAGVINGCNEVGLSDSRVTAMLNGCHMYCVSYAEPIRHMWLVSLTQYYNQWAEVKCPLLLVVMKMASHGLSVYQVDN